MKIEADREFFGGIDPDDELIFVLDDGAEVTYRRADDE